MQVRQTIKIKIMKKIIIAIVAIVFVITFYACYYDKKDVLYPTNTSTGAVCDTSGTVSYSQKVVPILQQACYGCHSVNSPSGNIAMSTYATDKVIAQNGKLYGSIAYLSGFSAMPKGGNKLTDCQIATIKKWIDAGMPNN